MKEAGYLVKFKNFQSNPKGTGRLHYEVLAEKGQVIWGQWTTGNHVISENTYKKMNSEVPFSLYALDKNIALLKMTIERVLRKEEVLNEHLESFIPSYYSVDTPCASYYLISHIEILPVEESMKICSRNGTTAFAANQVSSVAPWQVFFTDSKEEKKLSESSISLKPIIKPSSPQDKLKDKPCNYVVYRYFSNTLHKSYIGMTNDFRRRKKEHESSSSWNGKNRKKYLYTMFQLLGLDDFEVSILHENLTEEEAHYWEAKEIDIHNAYYPNGLNERDESRYLI